MHNPAQQHRLAALTADLILCVVLAVDPHLRNE